MSKTNPDAPARPAQPNALEDDFDTKLVRRKGRIAQDIDLEV